MSDFPLLHRSLPKLPKQQGEKSEKSRFIFLRTCFRKAKADVPGQWHIEKIYKHSLFTTKKAAKMLPFRKSRKESAFAAFFYLKPSGKKSDSDFFSALVFKSAGVTQLLKEIPS